MRTKFNGILTLILAFVVQASFAQMTITGTVTDDMGPIPGASVLVKGTQNGTVTDFDGKYTITANTGDTLVFSMAGNTTEKVVGTSNVIDAVISVQVLEGVTVVTALGNKREKRSLTTAIQNISGKDIASAKEANLVNSLSGKIAGIQVTNSSGGSGTSSRIVIRGASSLTGNNQPLFVVDGIPVDNATRGNNASNGGYDQPNGIADINPADIESMSVLKGPAAAALYGLRASNGVVLITTKSGKRGKGLGLTYSTSISFQTIMTSPRFQNSYGQGTPTSFNYVDGTHFGDGGGVDESWGAPLDRGYEFMQFTSYIADPSNPKPMPYVSHPNTYKDFFDVGTTISHSLSFSGVSEDNSLKYRLSGNSSKDNGIVPTTNFDRYNVSAKASYTANDRLTTSLNVNYINSSSDNLTPTGYDGANPVQQMIWSGRNIDFNALKDYKNLPTNTSSYAYGSPMNWNNRYQNNPFWMLDNNKRTYSKDRIIGGVSLNYKLTDWLSAQFKTGTDYWTSLTTQNRAFGTVDYLTGSYFERQRTRTETNTSFTLNSNNDITEKLSLNFLVGGNTQNSNYKTSYELASKLQLPDLYTLSNIRSGTTPQWDSFKSKYKVNSLYFSASFTYNNYLFLDVTGRNDWASSLPMANNSFFYPSVSLSSVLTDAFDMKSETLNYLKVRASWAKVGSVGPLQPYQIQQSYELSSQTWGGNSAALLGPSLSSDTLKPEQTIGQEIGIDARFFKNKLTLNLAYYDRTSTDLLLQAEVSGSTGFSSAWQNVGEMSNKGFEAQIGIVALQKKDFKLSFDLNFNKNENTVVSINDEQNLDALTLGGQWGLTVQAIKGKPYGVIMGYDFERTPNGDVIYQNGLPVISTVQTDLGSIQPDWTGGLNTKIDYKNFYFNALIDAKMGGYIHSMTNAWGRYSGVLEETMIGRETGVVGNGVELVGGTYVPNTTVVSAKAFNQHSYSNSIHSSSVFDASYIKLREVQFGYKFADKLISKTGLSGARLSVSGRNLAILYKNAPHIDPESAFSSSNGDQGQEFGQIPSTSSYSVNLSLKF